VRLGGPQRPDRCASKPQEQRVGGHLRRSLQRLSTSSAETVLNLTSDDERQTPERFRTHTWLLLCYACAFKLQAGPVVTVQ
jgi:hypothetical protein